MVDARPEFGENILSDTLNELENHVLVTMDEPWELLEPKLRNSPEKIIRNYDMKIETLQEIENQDPPQASYIVGFGGGTSCDTAKYLSWKWNIPLIISPSIISVDAWLCTSIAVRIDHKVRYIGNVQPERVLVDYSLIKAAPKYLNRAGISDTISITTALGDWVIAREKFNEKFDQDVFDKAKQIAQTLMDATDDIRVVNNNGIQALVKGYVDEVDLCEKWGNARPEEGGEHFLAYRLEEITRDHYIHGNLIALNVLTVLKLQRDHAVFAINEMKEFFTNVGISFSPVQQGIAKDDYISALKTTHEYVIAEDLAKGIWSLNIDEIFDDEGEYSIESIADWIFNLK